MIKLSGLLVAGPSAQIHVMQLFFTPNNPSRRRSDKTPPLRSAAAILCRPSDEENWQPVMTSMRPKMA
ncbi:hypothetical protein [Sphingopyxis chilensis]|uniref:hypothetical protein n=1 Tax=Sphingopyxis chilensis TaxID=180400 RepID=UPI002DDD9541|nr:hypothetical protein [Sphingopyxis chilensis]